MEAKKIKGSYSVGAPKVPENRKIKFSFEYYDTSNKYCLSKWSKQQIAETLKRLKQINEKTFFELQSCAGVLSFHAVPWESTTEKEGFPDPRVRELEAFQFGLLNVNGQKARVFGAYARDTFYIVWFDLEHEIWPTFKKHT